MPQHGVVMNVGSDQYPAAHGREVVFLLDVVPVQAEIEPVLYQRGERVGDDLQDLVEFVERDILFESPEVDPLQVLDGGKHPEQVRHRDLRSDLDLQAGREPNDADGRARV